MALTTEEKKRIQARVKELESGGIGTQVAIKQAFDEVAGPNALAETIASKKTFAESETKEEIFEEEEIEKATNLMLIHLLLIKIQILDKITKRLNKITLKQEETNLKLLVMVKLQRNLKL